VLVRRPNHYCPDSIELKKQLVKKYPIERIELTAKNPPEPGGSIQVFIVVYLLKEIFGPTLKQMVKDLYKFAKKQMAKKTSKLSLPPTFIHNGAPRKKRPRKTTGGRRAAK
jgi:hypothetical protein